MSDSPNDFSAVAEILRDELCQHVLCLKAGELIAAATKYDLDIEKLTVRELVNGLAIILQETGYVPGAYYDSDAPDIIEAAPPYGTLIN